jgi:ABC-type uncharacterized transport system permease subunit
VLAKENKPVEIFASSEFWINFLQSIIRLGTPLLLAGLGEVVVERSGVINIGMEGMMMAGALFAVFGSDFTGNPWIGVLAAGLIGAVVGLIFAFVTVTLAGDQIVSGTAINIFSLGMTTYLFRLVWGVKGVLHTVPKFDSVKIPLLGNIPVIGPGLFEQSPLIYLAFVLVPLVSLLLFRTMLGLSLRSVGEHPRAADTVGINVIRTRYLAIIFGGVMAGIAGSVLTISNTNSFLEGISSGRGFITLAAVIFGNWTPVGVMLASLFFGSANAVVVQFLVLNSTIPYQIVGTLPYVLTILALVGVVGKAKGPKALATPYLRNNTEHD